NAPGAFAQPVVQINQILRAERAGCLLQLQGVDDVIIAGIGVIPQGNIEGAFRVQYFHYVAGAYVIAGTSRIQGAAAGSDSVLPGGSCLDLGVRRQVQASSV